MGVNRSLLLSSLLNSRPYRNISLGSWVNWEEWPDTKNLLTNIRRHWRYKDPEQKRGRKKGREHLNRSFKHQGEKFKLLHLYSKLVG
jgi:hypothetical protein